MEQGHDKGRPDGEGGAGMSAQPTKAVLRKQRDALLAACKRVILATNPKHLPGFLAHGTGKYSVSLTADDLKAILIAIDAAGTSAKPQPTPPNPLAEPLRKLVGDAERRVGRIWWRCCRAGGRCWSKLRRARPACHADQARARVRPGPGR